MNFSSFDNLALLNGERSCRDLDEDRIRTAVNRERIRVKRGSNVRDSVIADVGFSFSKLASSMTSVHHIVIQPDCIKITVAYQRQV